KAGYAPAYYGNTGPGSAFANAWCTTTQQRPDIANNAFLWSFEPSLMGNYTKNTAPPFGAYSTHCPGHYAAWQYLLSADGTPVVPPGETEVVTHFSPARRAYELTYIVFAVICTVILLRIVLKVLAANPAVAFTSFIYGVSDFFLGPFRGLLAPIVSGRTIFEP